MNPSQTTPTAVKMLTVKDVAERLDLHENKVRELIRKGELPAIQIPGGRGIYRIDLKDFNQFCENNKR